MNPRSRLLRCKLRISCFYSKWTAVYPFSLTVYSSSRSMFLVICEPWDDGRLHQRKLRLFVRKWNEVEMIQLVSFRPFGIMHERVQTAVRSIWKLALYEEPVKLLRLIISVPAFLFLFLSSVLTCGSSAKGPHRRQLPSKAQSLVSYFLGNQRESHLHRYIWIQLGTSIQREKESFDTNNSIMISSTNPCELALFVGYVCEQGICPTETNCHGPEEHIFDARALYYY